MTPAHRARGAGQGRRHYSRHARGDRSNSRVQCGLPAGSSRPPFAWHTHTVPLQSKHDHSPQPLAEALSLVAGGQVGPIGAADAGAALPQHAHHRSVPGAAEDRPLQEPTARDSQGDRHAQAARRAEPPGEQHHQCTRGDRRAAQPGGAGPVPQLARRDPAGHRQLAAASKVAPGR
jgi:hypothetical protein